MNSLAPAVASQRFFCVSFPHWPFLAAAISLPACSLISFTISWGLWSQMPSLIVFMPEINFLFQFSSVAQSCPTLCNPMNRSTPGLPVHHQLLESTQTHVHWVSDAIQPSHPLLSSSLPALNLSQHQGLFQWVSSSPKYWSFSFNISHFNEHPGLISLRMDWLDLFAVQGCPEPC